MPRARPRPRSGRCRRRGRRGARRASRGGGGGGRRGRRPWRRRRRAECRAAPRTRSPSSAAAWGRKWKMPPPSLSMTTMRTGVETSRSAARPPTSCRRPRSPVTIVVGRPLAWAAPIPEEIRPSIPLAPRLQRKSASASRPAGTPPGRGSACSRRCRRGRRRDGRRRARAAAPARSIGPLAGAAPRRSPPVRRRRPGASARRTSRSLPLEPRRPAGRQLGRVGAQRAPRPAGSARSSRRRGRRRSGRRREPASQARSGLLVGISPKRRTRSGTTESRKSLVAQQQVVGGDDVGAVVRAAAQLRGRLGEDREAGDAGEVGERLAQLGIELAAGDDHAGDRVARCARRPPRAGSAEGSRSIGVTAVSGRSSRPSSASGSVAVTAPSTGHRRQRLAPGQVEVDRAGARLAAGGGERPAGGRAVVQQPVVVGLVGADLAEPAHRGAVELDLVDRLAGADPAQLRRPVGGQHDQRHRRTRRPRRSPGGSWPRRCPRCRGSPPARRVACAAPSAKKAAERSSTITVTSISGWRQSATRERRRARAGGEDRVAQPAARQLLDEGGGERGVGVGRVHAAVALSRLWRKRRHAG